MPGSINVSAKLILFGEWAVLKGLCGVGCTLNKNFSTQILEHKEDELLLSSSKEESVFSKKELESFEASFFKFFLAGAQSQSKNWPQALLNKKIKTYCSWKSEEGLGTSSAALLSGALTTAPEAINNPLKLWSELLPVLKSLQGGKGSGFDLALQIFGGALCFQHLAPGPAVSLTFPSQVFLLHSGNKMDTTKELKFRNPSSSFLESMGKIAENFMAKQDWPKAISESHECLKSEGILDSSLISSLQDVAAKASSPFIWKTCGAGGGDSLLCWSEDPLKITQSAAELGFWSTYPLKLGQKARIGES